MSIRRAASGASPTPVTFVRRADAAFLDVEIAWCQPPVGPVGAPGDEAPPAWSVFPSDGTVQAELIRTPAPGSTLAAVTDPFACGPTTSPARISATRVALATPFDANATGALTAYACSPTEPAGYALSTDATGGLWAAPTSTVAPANCAVVTSAIFGPLLAGPVQLQRAPTPTTDFSQVNIGNLSWPNAGVAALCGPYVLSALANANYSAPLQSIGAAVQSGAQNKVFGALGPVGGSIVVVTVAAVVGGVITGLTNWMNKRQKAAADANAAGPENPPPGGDVAADPQAIALAPQRDNPLAAADKLATPLTMPKTYDELVGAGGNPFDLAPTLSYGADSPPATPEAAPTAAPTTGVAAATTKGPSNAAASAVSMPSTAPTEAPASAPTPAAAPAQPLRARPAPVVVGGRGVAPGSSSAPANAAPFTPLPSGRGAVPSGAVGAFSRAGGRTTSIGASVAGGAPNRRGTFAGTATAPSVPSAPTPGAGVAAGVGRAARPSALTPAQTAAFAPTGSSLRTPGATPMATPLATPMAPVSPGTPAAAPTDDRQALLSRFYR